MPLIGQQNLVPNPSFEIIDDCPPWGSGGERICTASPWFQPYNYNNSYCGGSTELYHACSGVIPYNFGGYQFPSFGDGMAGMTIIHSSGSGVSDDWREYLEIKLSDSIKSGRFYCVKWSMNLANISRYGSNRIGAVFTSDTLFQNSSGQYDFMNYLPQIENLEIVSDTSNWVEFSESFLAQGGEQFMTVGSFRTGSLVDTSDLINPSSAWAYYYFDDFGVYLLPEIEAGVGASIYGYETTTLNGSCIDCWNGLQFTWEPSEDFEDPHNLYPQVSPDVTTTYYLTVQDTTGTVPCMNEVRDSVTIYVKNGPDFIVFPNPSIQDAPVKVYIGNVGGGSLTIRVHDIKGKLIHEKLDVKPLSTHELDLKLSVGMYTVTLISEVKIVETKKLVIKE